MKDRVGIGVIGCGAWGQNHVRVFAQHPSARLIACADPSAARRAALSAVYPSVVFHETAEEILAHDDIDAVVIATPTATHHDLVAASLGAGKHVLAEKPLAVRFAEAEALVDLARRADRVLMVGHVFLFNPGILWLADYLSGGGLGRLHYVYAERTNLGPVRSDVDVIHDLASHDVSILQYLLGGPPVCVNARGASYLQAGIADVAFCTLTYASGVVANIHASWLHPRKVREITCVGAERMVVWNDLPGLGGPIMIFEQRAPEQFYDDFGHFQWLVRQGDIHIPTIPMTEPLQRQAQAFLDAVRTGRATIADGRSGAQVVRVLEALALSAARDGARVDVDEIGHA